MAGDREAGGRICLGVMVGAHGVRGLVKVKSFTADPADVVAYGPLSDDSGARRWRLEIVGPAPGKSPGKRGDVLLARVESVRDRDAAQALHGRSEEHTSELQSLMRISYAVFCLKKKKTPPECTTTKHNIHIYKILVKMTRAIPIK